MNWTPHSLTQLATGYWQSATLVAAVELGIFDHLDHQSRSANDLATVIHAQLHPVEALLDALVSMRLLVKQQDQYLLSDSARPLLAGSSPTSMLDALRYNVDLYKQWGHLSDAIRTGQPVVPSSAQLGGDPAATQRFVHAMEAKARAFSPDIAKLINLKNVQTLLDVGSGPGTLSRLLAEQNPSLYVTLLDLPDILEIAKNVCATSPARSRLKYHAADYRNHVLPAPYDAILFAGALHQESTDSASALFDRFSTSIQQGGKLFIVDLMLEADRTHPSFSTLFQLSMLLIRPDSRVFSNTEISQLLSTRGFSDIQSMRPEHSPYRLITATR